MIIRYKVVLNKDRSSSFAICQKYKLYYKKGTIVNCVPGTLGIFCFETHNDAINYITNVDLILLGVCKVLRVKPIGRCINRRKTHIPLNSITISKYYNGEKLSILELSTIPKGTIFYNSVYVLD